MCIEISIRLIHRETKVSNVPLTKWYWARWTNYEKYLKKRQLHKSLKNDLLGEAYSDGKEVMTRMISHDPQVSPYPSEQKLQEDYVTRVNWDIYKTALRREMLSRKGNTVTW